MDFNPLAVGNTYINTLLRTDATLNLLIGTRILANFSLETMPGDTVYPLVSFHNMSARGIRGMGAQRIFTNCLYAVIAHSTGGYGVLSPVADRIMAAFDVQGHVPVIYNAITYAVSSFCEDDIELTPDVLPGGQVAYGRGSKVRLYISEA